MFIFICTALNMAGPFSGITCGCLIWVFLICCIVVSTSRALPTGLSSSHAECTNESSGRDVVDVGGVVAEDSGGQMSNDENAQPGTF